MINAQRLVEISKQAPAFIRAYEDKQRLVAAQSSLYMNSTDLLDKEILGKWIAHAQEWLNANQDKYNTMRRISSVSFADVERILQSIEDLNI
jgi:hypothetical protein